jgi:hypothetical protein
MVPELEQQLRVQIKIAFIFKFTGNSQRSDYISNWLLLAAS